MVKSIKATNFLSWAELEFEINSGITLIDGFNEDDQTSEGSGKSAVLNALSWGIYGKLPKDVKIDEVIKNGEKSCSVEIAFDAVKVIRKRNKNDLYCIINGEEVRGKDAKETQDKIEALVGLSFETFCQTVYFAQNYGKKFITSNQEEKGKILSEIQNLEIFDKARKQAQSLSKDAEQKLTALKNELVQIRANHEIQVNQLKSLKDMKETLLKEKQIQINTKTKEVETDYITLDTLKQELIKLEDFKTKIPVDGSKEEQLRTLVSQLGARVIKVDEELCNYENLVGARNKQLAFGKSGAEKYKKMMAEVSVLTKSLETPDVLAKGRTLRVDAQIKKLKDFIANPSKNCPTCGTLLETSDTSHSESEILSLQQEKSSILEEVIRETLDKKQNLENEATHLLASLKELSSTIGEEPTSPEDLKQSKQHYTQQIEDIKNQIEAEQIVKRQYEKTVSSISLKQSMILNVEKTIIDKENAIEKLKVSPINFDESKITKTVDLITTIEAKIADSQKLISKEQKEVDSLDMLKDGFKELKTHVFNSALSEINNKVDSYLKELFEVPISVVYSSENMKIETQINYDGEERSLGLLSGGQFRRVSLATDLAIADVVNSRKDSKFGLTILDEYMKDLSESSMSKCVDLLQQRKTPVIMIEHNSIFKQIIDNSFFVRLKKGTSERSE